MAPERLEGMDDAIVADVVSVSLARKRTIDPSDLSRCRVIVPPVGRPLRDALDVVLRAAGVARDPVVEAGGWP